MDTRRQGTRVGEGLKVLVVDDDWPRHAETVSEALEKVGYECAPWLPAVTLEFGAARAG